MYTKQGKASDLYRTYNISKPNWGNDIGSMVELIERRFSGVKTRELPDLIVVDGGKTHLKKVLQALEAAVLRMSMLFQFQRALEEKLPLILSIFLMEKVSLSIKPQYLTNLFRRLEMKHIGMHNNAEEKNEENFYTIFS